jgi:hypothetical protein
MLEQAVWLLLASLISLTWCNIKMWNDISCWRKETPPSDKEIRKRVNKLVEETFMKTYEDHSADIRGEELRRIAQQINDIQLKGKN